MRRMLRKLRTALTGRGTMGVASLPSAAPAGLTEILETLDDGLLVTDLSLTIVQWNAAMERLSGLPRASAIGRNRSEERRVGKECRARRAPYESKKKSSSTA